MKTMKKLLAVLLAGVMVAGLATGCGGKKADNTTPLVIACDDMSEKFSEFFAQSVPDRNVVDMTAVALLGEGRTGEIIYNGIKGETIEYNGTDYTYKGIADCVVTENADGTVSYDFTLRDDVKFSDGEKLTADDVIFSYYVYADPLYDGSLSLYSIPIVGMEEYRSNMDTLFNLMVKAGKDNTDFTYWDEPTQTAFWPAFETAGAAFAQEIVDYCAGAAGTTNVSEAAAAWGFAGLAADATALDFFYAMCEGYGWDIATLSSTESAGSDFFTLMEGYENYAGAVSTGESAANIAGIEKTGEYSVRVTTSVLDATAIYQLAIRVQPLHYYGDESAYDYDNNKFGFEKGDLSSIKAKTTTPMGAGPYKFVKFENKIVYMEANENYYKGEPKIKYLQFKTTGESDKLPAVTQGTVDIAEPALNVEVAANIEKENSNGKLSGDKITTSLVDYKGYGYIGINSNNVKVGNDHASEASKNLRKAIATVLSVYRDVAIDSYYGEVADVINYPISNTSWAAPQKSDPDYAIAFSVDVNGDPIYTEGMSEDDKYAAAKEAALEYLQAAGYTVADGKVTAAPAGAKMEYELIIPANGQGDHPSFGLVTSASQALAEIGFTLEINDLSDSSILWDKLDAGTAELWCAAWSTTVDPDMFQIYHSEGGDAVKYAIYSDYLDKLIIDARSTTDQAERKAMYKEALEFVVDFAVEVPIYQRQESSVYSTERVKIDTIAKDQTSFYTWMMEIENLEMN